ncbi:APC family permease [Leptolyngbya sp. AN03gr2]|uniref:APC family permease n=1 Tax=unclassified Leptolyngbya TaxID=2650499 RepID=UPI003D31FF5F
MTKLDIPSGANISNPVLKQPLLSLTDAIAIIVGVVIGAGIFETPALVAANSSNSSMVILIWIIGGVVSFSGALCYAELATTYPHVGGNYEYLKRAFGQQVAFLFAWARMTVVQTGSIALLAFVFGDYGSQLLPLGAFSNSIYAVSAIALLTSFNLVGIRQGKQIQNLLTVITIVGLLAVIVLGLLFASPNQAMQAIPTSNHWGSALLFVLLSYGGWNEAAYISAEIRHPRRNIVRSLLWSIGIITALYLLINVAYLRGLGLSGMAQSKAIAADLMRQALGEPGAVLISVLIAATALGSLNASIFTGARTNYAFGQDVPLFQFLGRWRTQSGTPMTGFIVQSAIALLLILMGTLTRNGFEAMVDYTAPVFWFFFLLSGISLILLRIREPYRLRPFQVPFYPITPLLFCAVCGYLLYSSLVYTGISAIAGVIVVALGIPFMYWSQRSRRS